MSQSSAQICFIMQHVTPGTHMDYVFEMARTLHDDEGLPLRLLIEKPSPVAVPDWSIVQRFSNPLLRVLENFYLIARERACGTKIFYVHYSFVSAISAGIITRLFGGTTYYWNAGMPWQYKRPWYQDLYQKIAYKLIHVLVTGADALVSGYCKAYGINERKVIVIPNWIKLPEQKTNFQTRNTVRSSLGIGANDPVLLFVQKHSRRKGAHLLLDIFKAVTVPDAHLVIAGDGPLRKEIETKFHSSPSASRAHFVGSLSRSAVMDWYQSADVFLLPSEEEGSPHALIEALAYGLPSVVSDVGGVRETMTETLSDWVLPYGDTAQLAHKISLLLSDKTLYQTVAHQSKIVAKNYEKLKIVDRFVTLFK